MKDLSPQHLQEIINLLYYILAKMPHLVSQVTTSALVIDIWLDNQDVMQRLHISSSTLQRWRKEGLIPYFKIKGKIWYSESSMNKMIKGAL